jgi:flagellar biosynthesis protein FlhF
MRLKSFTGKTLADAMSAVRAALGDDAIIIATRDADDGSVQVTAALDERPIEDIPENGEIPQAVSAALMEDDAIDGIADALQRHGTPVMLAETIMAHTARHFNGDLAAALAAGLGKTIAFAETPDTANNKLLMVGPPGAGKTAMIGKLAARNAIAGKRCAAISTDLERAGGVAQLAAYTSSLKMPLMEVEDPNALRDAIDMQGDADILFIDTTGINPFDPHAAAGVQRIIKITNGTNILVLPAGLEAMDAAELATAFKAMGATYLLPTRLDLTRRLGSLLAIAAESNLALCMASASPSIAAGLEILTPQTLAARILGLPVAKNKEAVSAKTAQPTAQKTATHGKR